MLPHITLKTVRLFQDGAALDDIRSASQDPMVAGFTTNPTLMAKAGIRDYERFAREALEITGSKPISFEVFADEFGEMARQARLISRWGENTYVKIPVSNTKREPAYDLVRELSGEGIKLNVTAILSERQIELTSAALMEGVPSVISVFAGRIADTGVDPVPLMRNAAIVAHQRMGQQLLWASPRELLNVFQADECGCDIITATPDILNKLSLVGRDLEDFSLDTVKMFYEDATKAGFAL